MNVDFVGELYKSFWHLTLFLEHPLFFFLICLLKPFFFLSTPFPLEPFILSHSRNSLFLVFAGY